MPETSNEPGGAGAARSSGGSPAGSPAAQRAAMRKERAANQGAPGGKTGLGLTRTSAPPPESGTAAEDEGGKLYLNRKVWLVAAGAGVLLVFVAALFIPAGSATPARAAPAWTVWLLLLAALAIAVYIFIAERESRASGPPDRGEAVPARMQRSIGSPGAEALQEASGALTSGLALGETLDIILSAAVGLLEGAEGSIMLVDTDGEHLETICYRGDPERYEPFARVAIGEGIAGKVARTRKGIAISGPADPDKYEGLVEKKVAIDSAMCVPLMTGAKLIGVLSVSDTVGGRGFDDSDLATLQVFANDAAAAIIHSAGAR